MSKLQWATSTGTIANLLIGVPATISLVAQDLTNNNPYISYTLISGNLPPGLTLSSTGQISGTPTYSVSGNNYFTTLTYNFIVRANSNNGYVLDGNFSFILENTVNNDFAWITPGGYLGTIPEGEYYAIRLQAETSNNLAITYSFISGELPPGMQLLSNDVLNTDGSVEFYAGTLAGVPVILNALKVNQSQTYQFTIRATSSAGHLLDQSFNLNITNVYNPIIEPVTNVLGTYFDGTYINKQLYVIELNPNVEIQWRISKGSLPSGISLTSNGALSGYIQPLQLIGAFGPAGYDGDVASGKILAAGNFLQGDTLTIVSVGTTDFTQIGAGANNVGRTFVATGKGTGTGTASLTNWNSQVPNIIIQQQQYDSAPFDFNQISQSLAYKFTVEAYDGANYDTQDYIIGVVSRAGFTSDAGNVTVDNTFLTVDSKNINIPILEYSATTLPVARQNSYYAYKFDGVDLDGAQLTYTIPSTVGMFDAYVTGLDEGFDNIGFDYYGTTTNPSLSNLPGLVLDANSGWLYGTVSQQTQALQNFTFGVSVSKVVNGTSYGSRPVYFTLPILGDVNNIIQWTSPTNLGTIYNGQTSEYSITAYSPAGKTLIYSLYDKSNFPVRLPQGLKILPSGDISGRVSFEVFSIDKFGTTIDGDKLTLDRTYNFTVLAADNTDITKATVSSYQQFTFTLAVLDQQPYENLYLQAMPNYNQRQLFNSIINNTEIFDPEYIYRPIDPWYGVQNNLQMLFMPGLSSADRLIYENAILKNHWLKKYIFGSVKTAVVLDSSYNIKYEVVYLDVIDPEENSAGHGAPASVDLSREIANPFIDVNGVSHTVIYPNSSENMRKDLANSVTYYDQSSLPPWMTSNQISNISGFFNNPIGYTKAVVLAYTLPDKSNLIAYRLNNLGFDFNKIDFTVDRYLIDNFYSTYFSGNAYIPGIETTFDRLPNNNVGSIVATVTYGSTIPFSEINGRSVDYIINNGGIDGAINFSAGQTLIFIKQENFSNSGPYDGWVDYLDAYIGDNITTSVTEGYDSESYDTYYTIPGYLERTQGTNIITGNNQIKTYSITQNISSSGNISVYVNNVLQAPTTYSIIGTTLTFNNAPANVHINPNPAQVVVYSGSYEQTFTSNGNVKTFNLVPTVSNPTSVLVNGVVVPNSSYTLANIAVPDGAFTTNIAYAITTVGNTDWHNIGLLAATANATPGMSFIAANSGNTLATGVANYTTLTFAAAPPVITYIDTPPNIVIQSGAGVNQRGGVWRINIVNNIVSLSFVKEILVNQRVQIISGKTFSSAIYYYDPNVAPGKTVPSYSLYKLSRAASIFSANATTFNGGTTKFVSSRDQYYVPGTQDKYLKFPQYGVFS